LRNAIVTSPYLCVDSAKFTRSGRPPKARRPFAHGGVCSVQMHVMVEPDWHDQSWRS
jgi:hypothetical protein